MKCIVHIGNKKGGSATVVRRKFVPIHINIERENQFVNASAKLPFFSSKVNALLVTSKINRKCNDNPIAPRYYFGITDTKMEDDRFLKLSDGIPYDSVYPPDIFVEEQTQGWWYFAHPVTDRLPFYQGDGFLEPLENYQQLKIQFEDRCDTDAFYLWNGTHTGSTFITFEEYT